MLQKAENQKIDTFELWCWRNSWESLGQEIKPVNPKGNQPWIFVGRTDAEAEAPVLWPPDAKSWLIGKDPDAGKDWRQKEKAAEDEMVGWHHRLSGHEFETLGDSEGQGSLVCCSPWVCRVECGLATEQQPNIPPPHHLTPCGRANYVLHTHTHIHAGSNP